MGSSASVLVPGIIEIPTSPPLSWSAGYNRSCRPVAQVSPEEVDQLVVRKAGLNQISSVPTVRSIGQRDKIDVFAFLYQSLHQRNGVLKQHDLIAHALEDHQMIRQ